MKAVLISIQPKWCELIASGKKTIEVRKTRPKLEAPFKVYIYCTQKGDNVFIVGDKAHKFNGKVIGEFVCDWVVSPPIWRLRGNTGFLAPRTEKEKNLPEMACLSIEELKEYVGGENRCVCGWHISNLVIYDEPKELVEFHHICKQPSGTDCSKCLDEGKTTCWSITRPPQSWCYVESEVEGE